MRAAYLILIALCLLFIVLFVILIGLSLHVAFCYIYAYRMSQIFNSRRISITYFLTYHSVILYSNFISILLNNLNDDKHCTPIGCSTFVYFYDNIILSLKLLTCYILYCCFKTVNYYFTYHIMRTNNVCVSNLFRATRYLFLIFSVYIIFIVWILCWVCLCFCFNAVCGDFCCFVLGCWKYYLCKYVCNPKVVFCHTFSIYNLFVTLSKSNVIAFLMIFSFHCYCCRQILRMYIDRP